MIEPRGACRSVARFSLDHSSPTRDDTKWLTALPTEPNTDEAAAPMPSSVEVAGAGTPPGRRSHVCFGHGDQLIMFDVWDRMDELEAFTATLMRILASE